jgi:thiamine phosphate synthase YjbQ (UPF0047 family)
MVNENADPDVQKDMEMGLNKIVPENFPYIHTDEGPDDMVSKAVYAGQLGGKKINTYQISN